MPPLLLGCYFPWFWDIDVLVGFHYKNKYSAFYSVHMRFEFGINRIPKVTNHISFIPNFSVSHKYIHIQTNYFVNHFMQALKYARQLLMWPQMSTLHLKFAIVCHSALSMQAESPAMSLSANAQCWRRLFPTSAYQLT